MRKMNYKISKNYNRLYSLMKKEIIICFVNRVDKHKDVCLTPFFPDESEIIIGTLEKTYIKAKKTKKETKKESFIRQCKKVKLEYVVP